MEFHIIHSRNTLYHVPTENGPMQIFQRIRWQDNLHLLISLIWLHTNLDSLCYLVRTTIIYTVPYSSLFPLIHLICNKRICTYQLSTQFPKHLIRFFKGISIISPLAILVKTSIYLIYHYFLFKKYRHILAPTERLHP